MIELIVKNIVTMILYTIAVFCIFVPQILVNAGVWPESLERHIKKLRIAGFLLIVISTVYSIMKFMG